MRYATIWPPRYFDALRTTRRGPNIRIPSGDLWSEWLPVPTLGIVQRILPSDITIQRSGWSVSTYNCRCHLNSERRCWRCWRYNTHFGMPSSFLWTSGLDLSTSSQVCNPRLPFISRSRLYFLRMCDGTLALWTWFHGIRVNSIQEYNRC